MFEFGTSAPFGMGVGAQEIDQQPDAEAGAAFGPVRFDVVDDGDGPAPLTRAGENLQKL